MKILAFDTATEACTVAVWIDGEVHERFEMEQRHAERLLILVDEVLVEGGLDLRRLDAIAFGRGPGSFTGLRIGAGVAQGLAFGADLPVVPVSSLAALAQGIDAPKVLAAIDARMQQVYWGIYTKSVDGLAELQGEEIVVAPADVVVPSQSGWIGVGSGWDQYHAALQSRVGDHLSQWHRDCYPCARSIAVLGAAAMKAGKGLPAEQALPVYVRDNVAVKAKTRS